MATARFPLALLPASTFRRLLAGAIAFAVVPAACWLGRAATYPAPDVPVGAARPPLEEVRLVRPSGASVTGWLWPATAGAMPKPALLFLHGNGENLQTLYDAGILHALHGLGAHVLAIDYPGYGRSQGRPSEAALVEAADAALTWLEQRFAAAPKVLVGFSLGAGVAAQLAARAGARVSGVALVAPWSTLLDAADEHYPRWLPWMVLRDRYDTVAAAAHIQAPVVIVHGADDRVIPPRQSARVAAVAPALRSRVVVPGAGHNDILDRPETWTALRGVLGP